MTRRLTTLFQAAQRIPSATPAMHTQGIQPSRGGGGGYYTHTWQPHTTGGRGTGNGETSVRGGVVNHLIAVDQLQQDALLTVTNDGSIEWHWSDGWLSEQLSCQQHSSTSVTNQPDIDDENGEEDQHEGLTRNDGEMPSGAGDHDLVSGSVDPGYGDSETEDEEE